MNSQIDISHPTWSSITTQMQWVYAQMMKYQPLQTTPDVIVGLTRGGLIPAVILSHMTGIPMIAAEYSSKVGRGDDQNHDNDLPPLHGDYRHLLIIDDIADSGHTLQETHDYYVGMGYDVSTAVLYYKESSVFKPTYHASQIPEDSDFIYFPWETALPKWAQE